MPNKDFFFPRLSCPSSGRAIQSTLAGHPGRRSGKSASQASLCGALLTGAALLWSFSAGAVGTRHFVVESGSDFGKGELKGAAVDSSGKLRPGWDLATIEVAEADSVWDALVDGGDLYLATGNEAKLLKVSAGRTTLVAKADAMAITSLERAFGRLLVGTMPGGLILELKGDRLVPFAELDGAKHVWGLSYDESKKALYAVTGPEGKVFRITGDGTAQVYFDSEQDHLVSVLAQNGELYVGSSGEARLYKITGPGRATVLYDFGKTEVRSMLLGADGSLFAAVNELKGDPRSDSIKSTEAGRPHSASASGGKGQLVRFHPDGRPETLYEDDDEHLVSLALDAEGRPVIGTGSKGRVVMVDLDHRNSVLADMEERQASKILLADEGGWVLSSDPVVAHPIAGTGGSEATYESHVLDAGIRARFGRAQWDGQGRFEVTSRSGNTEKPDETWSDWSKQLQNGGEVTSPAARYFQLRVRLLSADAEVTRFDVPFVTDNLRPVVTGVKAKSNARTAGASGIQKSGQPLEGEASSKLKLSWDVHNPDEDPLRYFVEYRLLSDNTWFDALAPGRVLTDDSLDWNTEDLPEGRYRVRVTASDELANPPGRVQKHQLESDIILVDNTAPRLSGLKVAGGQLIGVASDGIGPIQRLELRLPGQQHWIPFEPSDGIFDAAQEAFAVDLAEFALPETSLLTVRVFDTAGNFDLSHLRVGPVAR